MEPENDGLEDDFPLPGVYSFGSMLIFRGVTKNNIASENEPSQKETIVFQPSIFRGELLVSGRV